jgi:hypothetical protein
MMYDCGRSLPYHPKGNHTSSLKIDFSEMNKIIQAFPKSKLGLHTWIFTLFVSVPHLVANLVFL